MSTTDPVDSIARQYAAEDALAALEMEREAPLPNLDRQTSAQAVMWGLDCGPDVGPNAQRASHSPPAPVAQDDPEDDDTSYDDDVPLPDDDADDAADADSDSEVQPIVADPLPEELTQALQPHLHRAVEATQTALRERFGDRLVPTMHAANRTLARFASPQLRQALRDNPVLGSPDVVAMLAAVDRALRQGGRR